MVRVFCDVCGVELTKDNAGHRTGGVMRNRLEAKLHNFKFEILVTKDNVANTGDICNRCILGAFNLQESLGV